MAYQPIENYGVIGDMHTVALVGMNGSIDWLCWPRFDSPSVFAAILDDQKGGRFCIAPRDGDAKQKQFYWPDTNVLVTRFLMPHAVGQITDYMPVGMRHGEAGSHWLIRRVQAVRGSMRFRVECRPAFDYARAEHEVRIGDDGATFVSKDLSLGLVTRIPLAREDGGVIG
ncbi:MAG: trehalase-like domain-containing protein, partial [Myxococcota bacterium]